jgi:hypothetical protein
VRWLRYRREYNMEAFVSSNSIKTELLLVDWWNQTVYISGKTRCSRKDLVLTAADKDGGAHVDAALTEYYKVLMTSGQLGFIRAGENGTFQPIIDAHLGYLRQIGHEILNSPELLALAS